ncbi:MAG: Helicase superfamily 1 UvrD-related protein [Pelosinus sp.]|jgi:DNA helicase-2/ATP-dependent DNA helicase PcrA|nr:Helicase superfamily 1 UvrD-related protein [Pelosinus sp.]
MEANVKDEERQKEYIRLERTLEQIKKQLALSEENCVVKQSELKETLLNYWEKCGSDEAQLVETANRQRALSSLTHSTPLTLRKMLNSPYFGRIDFIEEEASLPPQEEQIYVGISTLMNEENDEFLIYDWRAPVSSMFYDCGLGNASYHCSMGSINGRITLKRQYKIMNGSMQYMFNADLKIDDEVLQEILGKSVDDKMHTIVNSIQREQNQIIRDASHRALFVEGPAGSGKTSVALHRIAFLLYRDREILNEKNVLILSPNHLFSDYISNVLPEMGEENVLQRTFHDCVSKAIEQLPIRLETRTFHLETVLSNGSNHDQVLRAENIRFKSSGNFEKIMQEYLDWIQTSLVDDYPAIEFHGETIFSKEEWRHYYLGNLSNMPVMIRLEKIKNLIENRMRPFFHAIRKEKEAEIIARAEEVDENTIKALARMAAREEFSSFNEKIDKLTKLNPLSEYRRLFKGNWLFARSIFKGDFPKEWQAIQKQTLSYINNGILAYEDIPAFIYFQGILQGFPVNRDIKHLIIDEAQDYTRLQLKILVILFPNSTWTVVGDPAQSVHPFLNTASFKDMSEIIGTEKAIAFRLTRSYRSTKQIQAFCQAILSSRTEVESVNRSGILPSVTKVEKIQDLTPTLVHTIETILNKGWRSIAIICKNTYQSKNVFSDLAPHLDLTLVIDEDDAFHQGIVVIPSYLAKGLEFDAVLVINADAINYSREEERHILYTICTRTLHHLSLFYFGNLSRFVSRMDDNLYEIMPSSKS